MRDVSMLPMLRALIAITFVMCSLPMAASARLMQQNVGTVSLDVGAICALQADKVVPAPATKSGEVGVDYGPYRFVLSGDIVPALPDLSVGMVVRLRDYQQGETLTLQAGLIEIGVTPDTWRIIVNDDGSFWVATSPGPGTPLKTGTYRFSAFRGRQAILVYDIRVRPASQAEVDSDLCTPVVS
jgi:hypothetical protein